MDCSKIGALIRILRKEKALTQQQLASRLHVSDKAVSKWERGMGCPDLSLLPSLAAMFGVELEQLLTGALDTNPTIGGNMKKLQFYICPTCSNLLTATSETAVSCCGKKLSPIPPMKASEEEKLQVELIENEYFISSEHPMTKDHYISFVAFLTGDSLLLRKLYPEWTLQTRLPRLGRGMLVWHCSQHGLYYSHVI